MGLSGNSVDSPPGMLLAIMAVLTIVAGWAGSKTAWTALEKLKGATICPACGATISIRPQKPAVCPECNASLAHLGRFRWTFILAGLAATMLLFGLTVRYAGPKLGFYHRCDFAQPSKACKDGLREAHRAMRHGSHSWYIWSSRKGSDHRPGVILHQWKYIGWMALLFFFAPFVVAWKAGQKQSLPSAGILVLLDWVGATSVALILLGFAQFQGIAIVALRIHVIGGVAWCLVGAAGALLGHRIQAKDAFARLASEEDA